MASNFIDSLNEFFKLKNLDNLSQLVLMDDKSPTWNPICIKCKNYKFEIQKILPKIEQIDGELWKDNKSILRNYDDVLAQIKEKSSINGSNDQQNETIFPGESLWIKSSVDCKINSSENTIKHLNEIKQEREKFKSKLV